MNARYVLAAGLASAIALAACGGGGGGASGPASAPAVPVATAAPTAPAALGSISMSIAIPRGKTPSGTARAPRFLSPGAAALAVYDGPTLIYVANLDLDGGNQFSTVYAKSGSTTAAPGSCTFTSSTAICNLTLTSTVGTHKFDLIVYPQFQGVQGSPSPQTAPLGRTVSDTGTVPAFVGVISSEGELSVTLSPGLNPGQTMTLLGVADQVIFAGLSEAAFNETVTYGYRIEDSTNAQIVLPGNAYDNGPVTITASPAGVVTITPSSIATPPSNVADQNFGVQCVNAAGGNVTISFNAKTSPNTAYASALTYSTGNYSGAVIQTSPFTCDAQPATIPITVQTRHR